MSDRACYFYTSTKSCANNSVPYYLSIVYTDRATTQASLDRNTSTVNSLCLRFPLNLDILKCYTKTIV